MRLKGVVAAVGEGFVAVVAIVEVAVGIFGVVVVAVIGA